jgi:hypothetical protein
MGRIVPPHSGGWRKQLPPRDVLEHLIEREKDHWFWDGDFHEYDGDRLAVLTWGEPACRYVVVRVLWVYLNNIDPGERLVLRRTCPYNACINPACLERLGEAKRYMLTKPLVLRDGTLVEPRLSRGFVHLQPVDVQHAMCGIRLRNSSNGTKREINCAACADTAVGKGYMLEEFHVE